MLKKILFFTIICLFVTSCQAFKPKKVDTRERSTNAQERARKNIEEGRGTSLGGLLGVGKTTYEFSTSNPLWRATLETLDFLPLSTVDYSGGVVITDWYSEQSSGEAIKITVRFMSNEIRSDSLKIIVHKKSCTKNLECTTSLSSNDKIKNELLSVILKKAAVFGKDKKKKK